MRQRFERTTNGPSRPGRTGPSAVLTPLLVAAAVAARLAGVSKATWHRLDAAGKVPRSVRLGGRVLWSVVELQAWVSAGCPSRAEWEARHVRR
jgi:predicted DNA-binding transcriptional regulator AlpA